MAALLLVAVLLVGVSLYEGVVLSILWGWFVVPALNAAPITVPVAIGISLIVNSFFPNRYATDRNSKDESWIKDMMLFLQPPIALGFGWIVHQFS